MTVYIELIIELKRIWHWLKCGNSGYITKYETGVMYLECMKCNYRTPGWILTNELKENLNEQQQN